MSFCSAGLVRRSPIQVIRSTSTPTAAPFGTSALARAIRSDSTFFNSNNSRNGSASTGQFQGKGLQRWEATLRDAPGTRRGFSVSYGSLGERNIFTSIPNQLTGNPNPQRSCSSSHPHSTSSDPSTRLPLYLSSFRDPLRRHFEPIPRKAGHIRPSLNRSCRTFRSSRRCEA